MKKSYRNFSGSDNARDRGVVIGIDEAGRGPLAGPLVVAGVKASARVLISGAKKLGTIRDSKKLSAKKREAWFAFLTAHPRVRWATAAISPAVIDKINIANAANRGAYRVYQRLTNPRPLPTLLDGSLYLPRGISYRTIIKGDEKIPQIAAASIIAKVTRDRLMLRLHKKYPQYGFDRHKGYGTKAHQESLRWNRPSLVHRNSFIA